MKKGLKYWHDRDCEKKRSDFLITFIPQRCGLVGLCLPCERQHSWVLRAERTWGTLQWLHQHRCCHLNFCLQHPLCTTDTPFFAGVTQMMRKGWKPALITVSLNTAKPPAALPRLQLSCTHGWDAQQANTRGIFSLARWTLVNTAWRNTREHRPETPQGLSLCLPQSQRV